MHICFPLCERGTRLAHYPPHFDCFQGGEMIHSSIDGSMELRNGRPSPKVRETIQCNVLEATIVRTRLDKDDKQLNYQEGAEVDGTQIGNEEIRTHYQSFG
jgi:hypothetical protein